MAFFAQTTASFCKNLLVTLVFEKNVFCKLKKNVRYLFGQHAAIFHVLPKVVSSYCRNGYRGSYLHKCVKTF
jgi:hypothetical protein